MRFTCKRKVGQIYINIPGDGAMSVEETSAYIGSLEPALRAAKSAFIKEYKKIKVVSFSEENDNAAETA